jgi:hypothetical protein
MTGCGRRQDDVEVADMAVVDAREVVRSAEKKRSQSRFGWAQRAPAKV